MANRRMLSKSISVSKKVSKLYEITQSYFPVLLYTWLHPHADDFGRYDADPFTIKHSIIPTFNVSEEDIGEALDKMKTVGLIKLWKKNEKSVLEIVGFEDHQIGLGKRTQSKYPNP